MLDFVDFDEKYLIRPADSNPVLRKTVQEIVEDVKKRGDAALYDYASRFDGGIDSLFVSSDEIEASVSQVSDELKAAIDNAMANIRKFHEAEMPEGEVVETAEGVVCSRRIVPIERCGLYVPGGTAPLVSTVLMLAVPASIAGCREIILATPAKNNKVDPAILYAARQAGVTRILKSGGAQAIAAMAYGTESVPRCFKLFGPGNSFVAEAKKIVSADVAIDMVAGPSEVMVVIDGTSDPEYAASDLLSQAEHGKDSQSMLVIRAESREEAEAIYDKVREAVDNELAVIGRHEYMLPSLSHSYAFPVYSDEKAVGIINSYAPEHLIINTENPDAVLDGVENAGSIFLGPYSPESAGDYASGTNHTLPTSGWAVSSSGVSVDSFIKKITVQRLTKKGLENISGSVLRLSEAEGLRAHGYAVEVRLK